MKYIPKFSFHHLTIKSEESKIFIKDPIYKEINFINEDFWLYELVNTFEFQRLSRIKQLGLSYLNFPSTVHNRLTHSLGVYEMANKFIRVFLERGELNSKDILEINIVKAVALLHDIGHGPMSHIFENALPFCHEVMSQKLISGNTGINDILRKQSLKDELNEDFYANAICSVLSKKGQYKWIEELCSSEVDIDRLDYLFRDSYFAGISYGMIDVSLFCEWARLIVINGQKRLVFLKKSKILITNYLQSRQHMYWELYENSTVITYEALFCLILQNVLKYFDTHQINDEPLSEYLFLCKNSNEWTIQDFLSLDDESLHILLQHCQNNCGHYLKELIKLFMGNKESEYSLHKLSEKEYALFQTYKQNNPFTNEEIQRKPKKQYGDNVLIPLLEPKTNEIEQWAPSFPTEQEFFCVLITPRERYMKWQASLK